MAKNDAQVMLNFEGLTKRRERKGEKNTLPSIQFMEMFLKTID